MQLRGVGVRFFRLNPSPTLRFRLGFNSKFHKCVGQLELLVGYLAIATWESELRFLQCLLLTIRHAPGQCVSPHTSHDRVQFSRAFSALSHASNIIDETRSKTHQDEIHGGIGGMVDNLIPAGSGKLLPITRRDRIRTTSSSSWGHLLEGKENLLS